MFKSVFAILVAVVFVWSATSAWAQRGPAPTVAPAAPAVAPAANPAAGLITSGQVTVSADPRTNSIVIVAPPAVLEQISQIIAQIDANPAASEVVMVYRLRNSSALNVEAVANMLLNGGTGANRGTSVLPQRNVNRISGSGLGAANTGARGAGR